MYCEYAIDFNEIRGGEGNLSYIFPIKEKYIRCVRYICEHLPNYRAIIVCSNNDTINKILNYISLIPYAIREIHRIIKLHDGFVVEFDNGSLIYIVNVGKAYFKGVRTNIILYEEDIERSIIDTVYAPMLRDWNGNEALPKKEGE